MTTTASQTQVAEIGPRIPLRQMCLGVSFDALLSPAVMAFARSRGDTDQVEQCRAACVGAAKDGAFADRTDPMVVSHLDSISTMFADDYRQVREDAARHELWRASTWAGYHFARNMLGTVSDRLAWSDEEWSESDELSDCTHWVDIVETTAVFGGDLVSIPDALDKPELDEDAVMAFDMAAALALFEHERVTTGRWPERSAFICACEGEWNCGGVRKSMPEPLMRLEHVGGLEASRGGCLCAVASGGQCGPRSCDEPVTHAGTRFFPYDKSLWLAFACEGHADVLTDPRPLTDRDRRELETRQRNHDLAMSGKPYIRPKPLRAGRVPVR